MRRGHSAWFAFALSFLNFVVLQYKLMIESVPFLHSMFSSLLLFAVTFAVLYVPIATLVGWKDYKKGFFPTETSVAALSSPWYRDMAKALIYISEGKNEKAKEILEKWTINE